MRLSTLVCALLLAATAASAEEHLRLSTTTSTENSGLLAVLLPPFEQSAHLKVDVIAVGSGKAMVLAENGDVDVVLSHAPELEEAFVAGGFGVNRRDVMYNDFVIVGPPDDPAGLRDTPSPVAAFTQVAATSAAFVSRGDESGTHQKEKAIWKAAGITPSGAWYASAGLGMGEVLLMANERRAYTLADRATYAAYAKKGDLQILVQGDPLLFNPYTIIAVNPARHRHAKYLEAMALIAWITSPAGQELIGAFSPTGTVLFHPTAVPRAGGDSPQARYAPR